ncbi:MAG TPA: P-II family nitrogen regulator [Candidatus Acidoferrales bacterium]
MKEIKAIIQPFVADKVISSLREMTDLPGVTVSQVKGFGRGRALGRPDSPEEAEIFGVKKIKLEIVVPDDLVEKVVQLIAKHAHTGNPGDGKIFVSTVDDVVKIRTGERGEKAI